MLSFFKKSLEKTREAIAGKLRAITGSDVTPEFFDTLETALLDADVGATKTGELLDFLRHERFKTTDEGLALLRRRIAETLEKGDRHPEAGSQSPTARSGGDESPPYSKELSIIVLVGVNGSGKTTVAGKLAHLYKSRGQLPLIVAADTFRAAATEQLSIWAKRAGARFVHGQEGGDPAAVVFDGLQSAKAHHESPVIVDTAGRLQTKKNLMDELGKIFRVINKAEPGAVTEGILVLDATLGQNMMSQAKLFGEVAPVSGLILTKLDGTSKGGALLSVVDLLKVPVMFVGTGESIDDLAEFEADAFAAALTAG